MSRIASVLLLSLILVSCSSGPEPVKPGTPAFFWNAATENYLKGDYPKAADQLGKILNTDNEYTARARAWRLILLAGLAQGHMEVANSYEMGARQNKNNPTPFRKETMDNRSSASNYATQFVADFAKFSKAAAEPQIPLSFPAPPGSPAKLAALDKVASGLQASIGEMESTRRDAIRRAVLLATCEAAGVENDSAKVTELLKSGSANVSRETFLKAMAATLYEQAGLFGKQKLGRPDHQKHFLNMTSEALKGVADSKESKELKKKIEADLKSIS
ncbi:MAG: hypothetical protein JST93_20510 [Acidobacteria bacterium]|nr:hypothetical protein [Acidobacteriota bacterium]